MHLVLGPFALSRWGPTTLRASPLGNHKNGTRQEPFLQFVLGRHSEERVSGEKGILRLLWRSDGVCVEELPP